jgi:hypothetical protein
MFPNKPIRVRFENPRADKKVGLFASIKEIAPLLTGLGTLLLSGVSFYFVHSLEREKENLSAIDLRQKALAAIGETGVKKEIAVITIADSGETALPAVRALLSGSADMRDFGIKVVQRWMDAGEPAARARLLKELSAFARSSSIALRQAAYSALREIHTVLEPDEKRVVTVLLIERFGSPDHMLETDAGVAQIACPLLSNLTYAESRLPLRNIANSGNSAAAKQALLTYQVTVKNLPAASCQTLVADLSSLQLPTEDSSLADLLSNRKDEAKAKCVR